MRDNVNKLTPGSNMLWESSRMMLPEHKEAILQYNRGLQNRKRPALDEQKREEIDRALRESLHDRSELELVLFDPIDNQTIRGKVTWIDRLQIKLSTRDGGVEWIEAADIVDVRGL